MLFDPKLSTALEMQPQIFGQTPSNGTKPKPHGAGKRDTGTARHLSKYLADLRRGDEVLSDAAPPCVVALRGGGDEHRRAAALGSAPARPRRTCPGLVSASRMYSATVTGPVARSFSSRCRSTPPLPAASSSPPLHERSRVANGARREERSRRRPARRGAAARSAQHACGGGMMGCGTAGRSSAPEAGAAPASPSRLPAGCHGGAGGLGREAAAGGGGRLRTG